MTPSIVRARGFAAAGLALVLASSGCRDAERALSTNGANAPRSITPHAVVTRDGSVAIVTLTIDVHGDIGKIGSFTGRLRYDPTALAFDREETLSDGTMRASNPESGSVRVAGASMSGVDVAQLAAFRFKVMDPAALNTLQFDIDEIHELSRANVHALVRNTGTAGTKK